jgi:hypothetical protein
MKLDKENLSKNGFWYGLGAFGLVWLVALLGLLIWGGDKNAKAEYEKAKTDIKGARDRGPKTDAYCEPWDEHAKVFNGKKNEVWADAWNLQKDMYSWPGTLMDRGRRGGPLLYPTDEFSPDERS